MAGPIYRFGPAIVPQADNFTKQLNANFASTAYGGFVNKFRNVAFDVWQRGTSITTSGAYTADGWIVTSTGASVTAAQSGVLTGFPGGNVVFGLLITGAASVTDVQIKQRIESYVSAPLDNVAVTVQVSVFNQTGGPITPTLTVNYPTVQDNYAATTNIVNAAPLASVPFNTWTKIAYTFVTTANTARLGLEVIFDFGNNFSTNGKLLYFTAADIRATPNVPTGINDSPSLPELRPVQQELAFCQRYFAKTFPQGTVPPADNAGASGAIASTSLTVSGSFAAVLDWRFPVVMRATPSITVYNPNNTGNGSIGDLFGGAPFQTPSLSVSDGGVVHASTAAPSGGATFTPAAHFTATAEL